MKATAKDLRFHSKELLNTVKRGEEIIITYRGKPCAKLIPYGELKKNKKIKKYELLSTMISFVT
ncbi:MAG: type II toxin-antitoxin system prevent-host-death family antitoxin [Desulfobacula sp.]|uniref:type II toxin-antitoxin system Phd/YefM family antitoxin n=1 Tax=Desulfobacula sp. TaxID=2593537 RepID=UPI0025C2FA38|nr:type II toxin-antitoxin system prevent-host-death family antitoxin [Desulfobacula sp.]MCD4718795.1 type II toxin-antitoxin system prevent-host-death family antitoxin [Desulfobacula sp.]